MSANGKLSPLQLNALASLNNDSGLTINPLAAAVQGTWTPGGYTPGSLVSSTVLDSLTRKIPLVYAAVLAGTTFITATTYRNLISIGTGVCPALGNSRPTTFKPTWAGWGSWTGVSSPANGTLEIRNYPPKGNYDPVTGEWLSGATSYSWMKQAYGSYGWISGWPGYNAWQKDTDSYRTVIEPPPGALINTYGYDEYFSNGFTGTIARQAYYETWGGRVNRYVDIANSFGQTSSYKDRQNKMLASYVNGKIFNTGTYSNMDDITTSDISGVTQSFAIWGGDLINTGRAINLATISQFGMPSALLKNLQLPQNNAVSDALKLALMMPPGLGGGNFTIQELQAIMETDYIPTVEQESRLYRSFKLIRGDDLDNIKYNLNCKTVDLSTLADLLDPRKLFPNSYNSLTVPEYNIDPAITPSSKIYYFIYTDGGSNRGPTNWGENYLSGILPEDLVYSCGAFAMTMSQIKNIASMDIERFSQVVTNLELTTYNNTLINTGNGVPVDIPLADIMIKNYGMGSGSNGGIRQIDFWGASSGYPYSDLYQSLLYWMNQLPTGNLAAIYSQIYNSVLSTNTDPLNPPLGITDADFQTLIDNANSEIAALAIGYPDICTKINYYWNQIGKQLWIEQRLIPQAIPSASDLVDGVSSNNLEIFTRRLDEWATKNAPGGEAFVLEQISDVAVLGGQSIVGALREARNAARLALCGGTLDNSVSDTIDTCAASASAVVNGGQITSVNIINGGLGYDQENPPTIIVYPLLVERNAKLSTVLADDGSISSIVVLDGGLGYSQSTVVVEISPPPQCEYPNPPQQTYSDTSWSRLIPPELVAPSNSSPTVSEAITAVTQCNCDCWSV